MEYESRVRGLGLPQSARDKGGEMALLMVQGALDFKSIEEPLSEGQIVSFKPKNKKKNGLVVIKSEKINICQFFSKFHSSLPDDSHRLFGVKFFALR